MIDLLFRIYNPDPDFVYVISNLTRQSKIARNFFYSGTFKTRKILENYTVEKSEQCNEVLVKEPSTISAENWLLYGSNFQLFSVRI